MTEKSLVNSIVQQLRYRGIYVVKIHGGTMQRAGLPDLWAVIEGLLFCFEVKLPKDEGGGSPTPRQQHEIDKLRSAGAVAKVVRSFSDVQRAVAQKGINI